jgi:predicted transcriptional regulator
MGRPATYHKARINTAVRLPPELHERLLNEAGARDLSANYLMVRAIEEFLDRLVPVDEWKLTRD